MSKNPVFLNSFYLHIHLHIFFFLQKFERKMINDKTSQFLSQVIFNEHVQSLLLFSLMTKVKTEVLDRVNSPLTIPRTVLIPSRNTGKAMSRYRMPFFQLSTHITSCQQKQQHPSCLRERSIKGQDRLHFFTTPNV